MPSGAVIGSAVYQLVIDDQIGAGIQAAERTVSAASGRIASTLSGAEQSGKSLGSSLSGVAGQSKSAGAALEGAAGQGRTLGSAMSTAAESSRGLGSVLGSVATQAAGFATGMLAMRGVSTVFDALKGATIGYNATLEQTTVAFTGLLGSGEKAAGFMKELQQFAAETPFEFTQLTGAAQKLMGVGMAARDVVPAMRAIGDAVAGMGGNATDIDRVTLALTQMLSNGKVQAQDMLQITSANIPAWQILAKSMGMSVEEVQKLSQEGKLLAKDTVPLLISGMETAFGGQMANQAKTFTGLFSTLKDNINQMLGGSMKPVFDQVKVELQGLVDYTNGPAFAHFGENLAAGATELAKQVGAYLQEQGPALERDFERVGQFARDDVPQLGRAFLDVAEAVGKVVAAVKDIGDKLAPLTGAVQTLDSTVLNGKGIEILVALYGLNKVGALSAGGSLLGKIPNPLGGGEAGGAGVPGPIAEMSVQAQVVNVNGPTSGGAGGGALGEAEKVAGGAGSAAGGGGIVAAATDVAAAAGIVAGTLLAGVAGAALIDVAGAQALDWLQGHPEALTAQQQAFQSDQQGIAFTNALQAGRITPPGYQDQSNRQLLEQNTIMQPQAASPDDLKAVNDAIANQNALLAEQAQQLGNVATIQQTEADKARDAAAAISQSSENLSGAAQAAHDYARAQEDAASGMARLRDLNDGASNTIQTTTQAEKDQITSLGNAMDANTQKMARLKEINEGAANTIQQTSAVELAQIDATNQLKDAQGALADTYQRGLSVMSDFNRQAGEYKGESDAISAAVQIVQDKQKSGIPLSDQENLLLKRKDELLGRLNTGQRDATEQAGLAAAANVKLMEAQDKVNQLLKDGVSSGDDYGHAVKALEDATSEAAEFGIDPAAQAAGGMNQSLSGLQGIIDHDLIPSLDAMTKAIGGIPPEHKTTVTADTKPAMDAMQKVEDHRVEDKSLTVNGWNKPALDAVDTVNRATVDDKRISIGGDNTGALGAVGGTNSAHVDNKTLDIYGNNVGAMQAIADVNNAVIANKSFTISAQVDANANMAGYTAQASGSPPGGEPRNLLALLNEVGPELVRFPYAGAFAAGGTVGFMNGGRPGFAFLPKGAEVIPADRTARLLESLRAGQAQPGMSNVGGGGVAVTIPGNAVNITVSDPAEAARAAGREVESLVLALLQTTSATQAAPSAPGVA